MRIVLTHLYAWPEVRRGGERYLHELASALHEAGHSVTILSSAPTARKGRVLGVEVRYFRRSHSRLLERLFPPHTSESSDQSLTHLGDEVAFAAKALSVNALSRVDVWHALGTADAAAAAAAGSFRPLRSVYTDLGIPDRAYRETRSDNRLFNYAVHHLDRYVCLSGVARDGLLRDYGRSGVVLGGGVDLRAFHPARARSDRPSILFTSTATQNRKNLSLLLDAVARMRERHPDLELWLASPSDPTPIVAAAPPAARDAVVRHDTASLEALVDLYGRAWVTALPSHHEAFGLVVVESMACGTPVVVLEGEAPAELVDEATGVTSGADAASLAEACSRALELARDRRTVDACRTAAQPHDWRTGVVPRIEAIYSSDNGDLAS